jgi:hypothetical protein
MGVWSRHELEVSCGLLRNRARERVVVANKQITGRERIPNLGTKMAILCKNLDRSFVPQYEDQARRWWKFHLTPFVPE